VGKFTSRGDAGERNRANKTAGKTSPNSKKKSGMKNKLITKTVGKEEEKRNQVKCHFNGNGIKKRGRERETDGGEERGFNKVLPGKRQTRGNIHNAKWEIARVNINGLKRQREWQQGGYVNGRKYRGTSKKDTRKKKG